MNSPTSSPAREYGLRTPSRNPREIDDIIRDLSEEEMAILEKVANKSKPPLPETSSVNGPSSQAEAVQFVPEKKRPACFMFSHKGIDPKNSLMRYWDVYTMSLLVFTALVTPYEVAFLEASLNVLFFINRFVDLSFLFDMILNFYLGFFDDFIGKWVYDLSKIRKRYLKSWFLIDVVSIIPFDAVGVLTESEEVKRLKVLRIIRLLRLFKLLRILRAARIFQRLESAMEIDYTTLDMVKYLTIVLLTSHWMACLFSMTQSIEEGEESWLHRSWPEVANPRTDVPHWTLYVVALYWSVMTATTIGYGDVVPVTNTERLMCTVCMLCGGFMFGYIIGAVGNVITSRNARHAEFCSDMLALNQFLSEGRFEKPLKQRLREFFKWRHSLGDNSKSASLLERMSPSLRGESIKAMDMWIEKVTILQQCPDDFVTQAIMHMERAHFPPGEIIVEAGSYDNAMYLVKQGLVVLGTAVGSSMLKTGDVWGEEMLYQRPVRVDKMDRVWRDQSKRKLKVDPQGLSSIQGSASPTQDAKRVPRIATKAPSKEDTAYSASELAVYGLVQHSAHSLTYCELYTLTSHSIAFLVAQFPSVRGVFRRAAICRLARTEIFAYCKAYRKLENEHNKALGNAPGLAPWDRVAKNAFLHTGRSIAVDERVDHYYSKLKVLDIFNPQMNAARAAAVLKVQRQWRRWRVRARMLELLPSQQRDKLKRLEVTLDNTPRVVFETKAEVEMLKPRVNEVAARLEHVARQQEEILGLLRNRY